MSRKTLLLVIGCHRAGTSAVAGSLAEAGVDFGGRLLPAAPDNRRGFYEDRGALAIHERLLESMGCSWDHPPGPDRVPADQAREEAVGLMAGVIDRLEGPLCGVKDPRATLFVPLWVDACKRVGARLCVIQVERDTEDVISSLVAREGWTRDRARALVEAYSSPDVKGADEVKTVHFPRDLEGDGRFYCPQLVHHGNGRDYPPPWTVIVPSRSDGKIIDFIDCLLETHPKVEPDQIVVVSDGLSRRTRRKLREVVWVDGVRPFVYSRAINIGAGAAHPDSDLLIVGDDVRFLTPGLIDHLWHRSHDVAAIAPEVYGKCGQLEQHPGRKAPKADWLTFNCVYIPRPIWDAVGPMDEQFTGYGYDDVDWCVRAGRHGELRIAHDLRVQHIDDPSFRSQDGIEEMARANYERLCRKWEGVAFTP